MAMAVLEIFTRRPLWLRCAKTNISRITIDISAAGFWRRDFGDGVLPPHVGRRILVGTSTYMGGHGATLLGENELPR